MISRGTSHQSTSVSGAIVGIQSDSEYASGSVGDPSIAGDSGIIMGAPLNASNLGNTGGGDDPATVTPTWLKTSSR